MRFRTLLELDEKRYDVKPHFHLALCVERPEGWRAINVIPCLGVSKALRDEQLQAFNVPPIGFLIPVDGAEAPNGVKIIGSQDGVVLQGHVTLMPPTIYHLSNFNPSGIYLLDEPKSNEPRKTLTTGACIRINKIFSDYQWPIPFTDNHITRNASALKEDGTISGCR